ncbi:AGE family epimerase/isomerase [Brachybacterium hainanense]|uniref:AGE family epimerase/isomerase n=1 Tax=Brachybacterium hainanense TaxID=1541174 RepID=A0ABV6RC92_9MICO
MSEPAPVWGRLLSAEILPWWVEHGADDARGGVLTCFDNRGVLRSTDKYTWSQGRWAWLAAELAEEADAPRLGISATAWAERSEGTSRFLLAHAVLPDASTAFRTDRDGIPLPDERDGSLSTSIFADLFAALGIGATVRIGRLGIPELEVAVRILETARRKVEDRSARTDPYPVPPGHEALAGWMNLLHTAAELLRTPAPEETTARVTAVRDAACRRLLGVPGVSGDAPALVGRETWWELRPDDPARTESLLARHRTPGHLLELLWMLLHAERTGARIPADPVLEALALEALRIGWDQEHGGLLRYADRMGGPPRGGSPAKLPRPVPPYEELVRSTWDTKLWWVHSEALYATAALARRTGSDALAAWHDRLRDYTLRVFPDPEHGEWIQIRDREGRPLDQVVALPVKDPFHISRALLLLSRLSPAPARSTEGHR